MLKVWLQSYQNALFVANSSFFGLFALKLAYFWSQKSSHPKTNVLINLCFTGTVLSDIGVLVNYAFIKQLPLEFFYIETIYAFFGGKSVYYLGVYGFGTLISTPEKRASLLARMDGFEIIARIFATILSPVILTHVGRYGNYGIKLTFTSLALAYAVIYVKDPERESTAKVVSKMSKNPCKLMNNIVVKPVIEMLKAIFKKRPNGVHYLVAIQYYMFSTYWFVMEEKALKYLYMLKTFDDFNAVEYSFFFTFIQIVNAIGLLVVLPILSRKFKMHNALLLCVVVTTEASGTLTYSGLINKVASTLKQTPLIRKL